MQGPCNDPNCKSCNPQGITRKGELHPDTGGTITGVEGDMIRAVKFGDLNRHERRALKAANKGKSKRK